MVPSRTTPNWKEPLGRVVLEGVGYRRRCGEISSGAIPEVVGNGGRVFPEGDPEALAHILNELIARPEPAPDLAEQGYRRVLERYSVERLAEDVMSTWKAMITVSHHTVNATKIILAASSFKGVIPYQTHLILAVVRAAKNQFGLVSMSISTAPPMSSPILIGFPTHLRTIRSIAFTVTASSSILGNVVQVIEELYRIATRAYIIIITPYFTSVDAFSDPTHRHYFSARSFDYFTGNFPEYDFYAQAHFAKRYG